MKETEQDLRILRGTLRVFRVSEDSRLCPPLEPIANGDGSVLEKVQRLGDGIEDRVRRERQR